MKRLALAICLMAALWALSGSAALAQSGLPKVTHFANCTALNKVYKHGVGKPGAHDHISGSTKPVTNFKVSLALYNANKGSDRDGDGIACEKR